MTALRFAVLLLASTTSTLAQADRAAQIADALQRNDRPAAQALAASEPELERRALWEAALVPLAQRPAAMLAVAQRFPAHPVAAAALQAGMASALMLQGRAAEDLPEVEELFEELGDEVPRRWPHDPVLAAELAVVVPQLLAQHRQWQADFADSPAAGDLRVLAMLSACQRILPDPAPVEDWIEWPLPRGLVDDLLISIRPVGDAVPTSRDALEILAREPSQRWLIAAKDTPPHLASPPAGRWLLELQSLQTPWRSWRVLDVGALAATCLVDDGVFAWSLDGDVDSDLPLTWTLWHGEQRGASIAGEACGVWPFAVDARGCWVAQARNGDRRARVAITVPPVSDAPRAAHVAHWQFDRPLHRAGEVLHGRAFVRQVTWTGAGLAARPATLPLAGRALQLRGRWPGGDEWRLDVASDERGMVAFAVPVPKTAVPGSVGVQLMAPGDVEVAAAHATEIASFRRPAMVASIEGPARVAASDPSATVHVRVQWASGGAAAGVPVRVEVSSGYARENRQLATGDGGRLAIPIAIGAANGRVHCECTVEGPDGFDERLQHTIEVDAPPLASEGEEKSAAELAVELPAAAVVGETVTVQVRGARYAELLGVVGRGALARAEPLRLDTNGTTQWQVEVTAADWPRLDVAVAGTATGELASAHTVVRRRAAVPVRIDVPATARPKERLRCRVSTAPNAILTIAVVDDRVFRLRDDPTDAPDVALRPDVARPQWRVASSAEPLDPRSIFGELLIAGRVPGASDWHREPRPSPGGGGPAGPSTGAGEPRTDFRATVCFLTAVADAQGNADLPIELPDDVTTWRCTVTAVDADGEGGLARATIDARLPLAAEPLLPRVLRRGDLVRMPLVLDRGTDAGVVGNVAFAVSGSDGVRVDADGTGERAVAAGAAATVSCALHGDAVGASRLSLAASVGSFRDRSERPLPVLEDTVVRPLASSAAGKGTVEVTAPAERDAGAPQQLVVMAGGAAAWHQLATRLLAYPYGCVEQTLSRLLPFAAANLGRIGEPSAAHRDRIGAGMARLRQLQVARGGAFAWWPQQSADLGMTGLVLHGLAVLRGGGVDPAAYGIVFDLDALRRQWQPAAAAAAEARASDRSEAVELLSGLLRLHPQHVELRATAASVADAATPLPRGCALRLGLALAAAGDLERARALLRSDVAVARRTWFPGEEAVVLEAQAIELRRAVGDPVAAADEVQLLRELLAGECRSYADGAALVALAPMLRRSSGTLAFDVSVDGAAPIRTKLAADGDARSAQFVEPITAGAARSCTVRCDDAEQLLFVTWVARTSRPGTCAAWAEPFTVERRLLRQREPDQWLPLQGDAAVGERLRVDVRLSSPAAARYVAVVCPLPAGFEVVGDDARLQRFDDRVVATFDRVHARAVVSVQFDVVATLPGDVLWPPATAIAMYDAAAHGGSDGCRLAIAPALPRAAATAAPFLQPARPLAPRPPPTAQAVPVTPPAEPPPTPAQLASDAWWDLAEVWRTGIELGFYGFDDEPDAEAKARVDAALARLFEIVAHDEAAVADVLEDQVLVTPGAQPGGALSPWRVLVCRRIDELRRTCLDRGVARCERALASNREVDTWIDVLGHAPPADREQPALRLLHAFWPRRPGCSEDVLARLAAPLRDPALTAFAATMLATADGDLLDELVRLLPEAQWHTQPMTVLVDAMTRSRGDTTARLLRAVERTPAGLQELRRRAEDPAWSRDLETHELGDEMLARLPFAKLAELASGDPERAARVLAAGELATRELWRLVLERDATLSLEVVVDALQRRGPVTLPAGVDADAITDPTVKAIAMALLAQAAPALLPKALAAAKALGDDHSDLVDQLVGEALARHGSAEQVAGSAVWLTQAQWQAVWARLDAAGQRTVLDKSPARPPWGAPANDDVLVAMLARADEWSDVDGAVATVLRSPGSEDRLRAILPRLPAAIAAQVRDELADWLGLDTATGNPLPDLVDTAIAFAGLRDWSSAWPAHLAAVRERLLRLRGLR
ncbi:MAG TPA: alpha-2-macroglobulin family protein [Planctomycetota bacterium]